MKKSMLTGKPSKVIPCYPDYLPYNNELAKRTQYPGYYATRSGQIVSVKVKGGRGLVDFLKPRPHAYQVDKNGYFRVCISTTENGKHRKLFKFVHRLVWETWNGEILDDLTIDHIDRNPENNDLSNLQLLTREKNSSLANKGRVNPRRYKYSLYHNGKFLGVYDRKQLNQKLGIKENDFYRRSGRVRCCHRNGYKWLRKQESVEDIEKVSTF